MTHLTIEVIEQADKAAIGHLETCERCRELIVTDVDLNAARARIMERAAATIAHSGAPSADRRPRPWVVVALAAAFVLAVFSPLLLLSPDRETDMAGETEVSLPEHPVSEPPPPPVPTNDLGSFEMTFTVGGRQGRLIWDSPTFHEGLVTIQEGPEYDYGFFRTGTDWGFSDSDESLEPGAEQPDIRRLPEDPEIPWDALINRTSVEETWSWVGGDEADFASIAPTHPFAAQAWSGSGHRLESTDRGIPVLIERPGQPTFEVDQLNHRHIRPGEVGNNTDLPFEYALYLAGRTTAMQRAALEDGLVTFADYEAAAAQAAGCVGIELEFSDSLGLFVFPEDPTTSDCVSMHVDDIAEIWRLDSQWLEGDEFVVIWHTIEGQPEYAAMHQVEPGPERALASGDGWAVSIAPRGQGYCIYSSADAASEIEGPVKPTSSSSEGCLLPEGLAVPNVLNADVTTSYEAEEQLLGASVVGIVTARADRVVVVWDSGRETPLIPGEIVEFGFRGFGMISHGDELGEPIAIEAYAGGRLLGTQLP